MQWNEEQKRNIERIYGTVENYEKQEAINKANEFLRNTDYVIIKMQEYSLLGKTVDNDYTKILEEREKAREVLRKYQDEEKNKKR